VALGNNRPRQTCPRKKRGTDSSWHSSGLSAPSPGTEHPLALFLDDLQ
jgi:hypothetical protein